MFETTSSTKGTQGKVQKGGGMCLLLLGFLELSNNSEWVDPSFTKNRTKPI